VSLSAAERQLLSTAATSPGDVRLRHVLGDRLIDEGHLLGELLRLESEERDLPRRRALEAELRRSPAELIPWASEVEFAQGLPVWARLGPTVHLGSLDVEGLPVPSISVTAELRALPGMVKTRALSHVHELDLSAATHSLPAGNEQLAEPLASLRVLSIPPGGAIAPETANAFSHVRELSVGIGSGFELPAWVSKLPALELLRLLPSREPGGGDVVAAAAAWAERRRGRCLEWLGRRLDASEARRALTPGLPGDRPSLPEEVQLNAELTREEPTSRVFLDRSSGRVLLRCDDAPAADVFAAPRHAGLVTAAGLVRVRRAQYVELTNAGRPLPLARTRPDQALRFARAFADALEAWWGHGAPDAFDGEWVGLGRDQLRLREGALAIVPALSRRLGPFDRTLLDVVGLPVPWGRTSEMIVRLTASALFEWLSGVSFLDAREGSALAVHRRLELRLRRPPSLQGIDESLARFDGPLREALQAPGQWTASQLLGALTTGSSRPG
jgi:hypothetical protein